jgi:phosphoribosyl-AMP cyclohydrolase
MKAVTKAVATTTEVETISTISTKYGDFITAGTTYGDALKTYAKQADCDPDTLFYALAPIHAAKYACNFSISVNGTPVFHTGTEHTRETRVGAATTSWSRNVGVHFTMVARKPKAAKDPVAALLKAYGELSEADALRFWAAFEA